jgi:hypothetical protein
MEGLTHSVGWIISNPGAALFDRPFHTNPGKYPLRPPAPALRPRARPGAPAGPVPPGRGLHAVHVRVPDRADVDVEIRDVLHDRAAARHGATVPDGGVILSLEPDSTLNTVSPVYPIRALFLPCPTH